MRLDNKGYALIEVVSVFMIGGVLANMAMSVTAWFSVNAAQESVVALHARARAHAVERGRTVEFHLDPAGDSAWVEIDGETLEVARFDDVDLQASGDITLCMTPRRIADTQCNSFSGVETVTFEVRGESSSLDIPSGRELIGS